MRLALVILLAWLCLSVILAPLIGTLIYVGRTGRKKRKERPAMTPITPTLAKLLAEGEAALREEAAQRERNRREAETRSELARRESWRQLLLAVVRDAPQLAEFANLPEVPPEEFKNDPYHDYHTDSWVVHFAPFGAPGISAKFNLLSDWKPVRWCGSTKEPKLYLVATRWCALPHVEQPQWTDESESTDDLARAVALAHRAQPSYDRALKEIRSRPAQSSAGPVLGDPPLKLLYAEDEEVDLPACYRGIPETAG